MNLPVALLIIISSLSAVVLLERLHRHRLLPTGIRLHLPGTDRPGRRLCLSIQPHYAP